MFLDIIFNNSSFRFIVTIVNSSNSFGIVETSLNIQKHAVALICRETF